MKTSLITPSLFLVVVLFATACKGPSFFNQELRVPSEKVIEMAGPVSAPGTATASILTWDDPEFSTALAEVLQKENAKSYELGEIRLATAKFEAANPTAPNNALNGIDSVALFLINPLDQSSVRLASLAHSSAIGSFPNHNMATSAFSIPSQWLNESAAQLEALVYTNEFFDESKELKFSYSWNSTISGESEK